MIRINTAPDVARLPPGFVMALIADPSTGAPLRRRSSVAFDAEGRRFLYTMLDPQQPPRVRFDAWEQFAGRFLPVFLRNTLVIRWGNTIELRRDSPLDNWTVFMAAPTAPRRAWYNFPMRSARAPSLPYINVDPNSGVDGQCVHRWLHSYDPRLAQYLSLIEFPTPGHVITACDAHGVTCELFDVMGNVMACANPLVQDPVDPAHVPKTPLRGVAAFNHVYPLTYGTRPVLGCVSRSDPDGEEGSRDTAAVVPSRTYHSDVVVQEQLAAAGAMVFRKNGTYHVGDPRSPMYGKWFYQDPASGPPEPVYEEWMGELLKCVSKLAWDEQTLFTMHAGTLPLFYQSPAYHMLPDTTGLVTIDMSRCYAHALYALCDRVQLGEPDAMFSRWEPVAPDQADTFEGGLPDYVIVTCDPHTREVLHEMGLSSLLMPSYTLRLLRQHGMSLHVTHYLRMRQSPNQEKIMRILDSWTWDQKKKYAVLNGIMGKTRMSNDYLIGVGPDPNELAYYQDRYGLIAEAGGPVSSTVIGRSVDRLHFHMYAAVIHMANYMVLRKLLAIRTALPMIKCVRVMTDSLTFTAQSGITPWVPTTDAVRRVLLEVDHQQHRIAGNPVPWHLEEPKLVRGPVTSCQMRGPESLMVVPPLLPGDTSRVSYRTNVCYIGAPGTGKTWRMLTVMCPDLVATLTNAGVQRLLRSGARKACTLHSMFGLFHNERSDSVTGMRDLKRSMRSLYGKVIGIDEAQTLSPTFWSLLYTLYHASHRAGAPTTFVFAMDPRQLAPIGFYKMIDPNGELPPFLGTVEHMTVDHRNDPDLISLREHVDRTGKLPDAIATPGLKRVVLRPGDVPAERLHIVYTHATRKKVNQMMMDRDNKTFGDNDMPYLTRKTMKKLGLCRGEVLEKREGKFHAPGGRVIELTRAQAERYLEPGYAFTAHSMIGETIPAGTAFGVWDTDFYHVDRAWLYTVVTRACNLSQLTLYFDPKRPSRRQHPDIDIASWDPDLGGPTPDWTWIDSGPLVQDLNELLTWRK